MAMAIVLVTQADQVMAMALQGRQSRVRTSNSVPIS